MSALPFLPELIIRTALIAAGTAAVLWALRVRAASVKHAAWSAVVVAMLVLPLLLAARVRMSLPVLTPAVAGTGGASIDAGTSPPATSTGAAMSGAAQSVASPESVPSSPPPEAASVDWRLLVVGAYLVGALILLARLVIGTIQANKLRRGAVVHNGRLRSDRCSTPITIGWWAPVLIMPRGWDRWSSEQLAVVLTHEREHARRRDPLTQWLALLNRALFWFHPLAWWLERRLATLAEEACDAAVLTAGHSPLDYSEYLLDMARTVSRQHGRVRLVGLAMPGTGLSERLRLILEGLPTVRVSRTRLVCTIAFCAISSVMFAAGTLAERAAQSAQQSASTFDVVSIKLCPDVSTAQTGRGAGPNLAQTSPGHVFWACVTVASLIDQAYAGFDFPLLNDSSDPLAFSDPGSSRRDRQPEKPRRVRGGPSWLYTERFTIEATAPVSVISPARGNLMRLPPEMNRALRALLADRFQVKLRRLTEERPMYALTVAKASLKARPRGPDDCVVPPSVRPPGTTGRPTPAGLFEGKWFCGVFATAPLAMQARIYAGESLETVRAEQGPNRRFDYRGVTLQAVADQLAGSMDRFVLDKTSVTGEFLFAVEFTSDDSVPGGGMFISTRREGGPEPPLPATPTGTGRTIFQALEALGLKLEPTKGPAEYLQIESAERPRPDHPTR